MFHVRRMIEMDSKRVKFITSNKHKFEEVRVLFEKKSSSIELSWIKLKYPELQGNSLAEIAIGSLGTVLSALTTERNEYYFLEDAGLFINILKGFPGPYSSYVFETLGWEGILSLLNGKKDRNAEFRSVCAVYYNGEIRTFTGTIKGRISSQGRGKQGFGFDPIFVPEGANETFAEMSIEEKNRFSHRVRSVSLMIDWVLES